MKRALVVMYAQLLVSLAGSTIAQKVDMAKEEVAIKSVIEGEINASFNGEYEKWSTFFIHEANVVWMQATNKQFNYWKGWEEISLNMKKYVKPERKATMNFAGNSDYIFRINGDAAFVTFIAKFTSKSVPYVGCEVRSLEKHDGEWKIIFLGTVYSSTYQAAVEETKEKK